MTSFILAGLAAFAQTSAPAETPAFGAGFAIARTPDVGEIAYFSFSFCPRGWLAANGAIYPISGVPTQNLEPLFSLLGTRYGGDGRTTFGVPDMRGRVTVGAGQSGGQGVNFPLGARGGAETVTLTAETMPNHTHELRASTGAPDVSNPHTASLATFPEGMNRYATGTPNTAMAALSIGESEPFVPAALENRTPVLPMSVCIAWNGNFPRHSSGATEAEPVVEPSSEPTASVDEDPGRIRRFFRRLRFWDREDG